MFPESRVKTLQNSLQGQHLQNVITDCFEYILAHYKKLPSTLAAPFWKSYSHPKHRPEPTFKKIKIPPSQSLPGIIA